MDYTDDTDLNPVIWPQEAQETQNKAQAFYRRKQRERSYESDYLFTLLPPENGSDF